MKFNNKKLFILFLFRYLREGPLALEGTFSEEEVNKVIGEHLIVTHGTS